MLTTLWLAALLQGPCDTPPAGPLQTVCPYLSALVALDHEGMAQLWSPLVTRVNLAGVEQTVDREFMRAMRDFEREVHTRWTFEIDSTRGALVYATLTESNDFYELIGVGKRTQTEEYLVRDSRVARMANTSMIQEKGEYGPAYVAFRDWLLGTEASKDPEITQGTGLRFTETSARHMLPWLKRYAELRKSE